MNQRMVQLRFACRLATLGAMSVWWSESEGRIIARKLPFDHRAILTPRKNFPTVPPDVIFVGSYAHPFPSRDFLSDLRDAIRRHAQSA